MANVGGTALFLLALGCRNHPFNDAELKVYGECKLRELKMLDLSQTAIDKALSSVDTHFFSPTQTLPLVLPQKTVQLIWSSGHKIIKPGLRPIKKNTY